MSPALRKPVPAATGSPESVDRLMAGVCAAIWLVWLVVAVVATVACVNLGRGRNDGAEHSPWLLYIIIAVSGLTIAGAVPLLLRARRDALAERFAGDAVPAPTPATPAAAPPAAGTPAEAPTEKIRIFGSTVEPARPQPQAPQVNSPRSGAADRQLLRGGVSILGAMGLGWIAVAVATYSLATASDTAAVIALAGAGIATGAIVAAFVVFSRRLGDALGRR